MQPTSCVLAFSVLVGASVPALAQSADGAPPVDMGTAKASDERLDGLRGGADLGPSLHVSFGLDRLTSVNGVVVASTRFEVQDIAHVTAAEAQAMQHALGSLLTLTDGRASLTALPAGNQSLGTVIQNSLPNQKIDNVLTLNLGTNSLSLLRATHAADQLRDLQLAGH